MMMVGGRRFATALFGAAAALLLAAAPYDVGVDGLSRSLAAGEDGNHGSPGGSNSGGGNSGNANSGKDSPGDGNSAGGTGNSNGKNEGAGKGPDPVSLEQRRAASGLDRRSNQYVDPETGTVVEVNGSDVEVLHADGFREEITGGRYRMNDAQGRIVIERIATESDRARFRSLIR